MQSENFVAERGVQDKNNRDNEKFGLFKEEFECT